MKQSVLVKGAAALTVVSSLLMAGMPAIAAVNKPVVVKKPIVSKYRVSVSAIRGKDEKNFDDPTSRCLTATMKSLHDKALKQMEADLTKVGDGHDAAVQTYRQNIDIIWSAMNEPYCGYGSRGVTAVEHSFQKSVDRTRSIFLAVTKK